jgi:hypothetical protein
VGGLFEGSKRFKWLVLEHDLDGDVRLNGLMVYGRGLEAVLADGGDGLLVDGGACGAGDGDVLGETLVVDLEVKDDEGVVFFVHEAVEGEGAADDVDESGGGGFGLRTAEVDQECAGIARGGLDGVGVEGEGNFIVHGSAGGGSNCGRSGRSGGVEEGSGLGDFGLKGYGGISLDACAGLDLGMGEDGKQSEGEDKL